MQKRVQESQVSRDALIQSYDARFSSAGQLRDSDSFYHWVLNKLPLRTGQRILDVACGEGHLVKFARQRNVCGLGIDFSAVGASLAKNLVADNVISIADGQFLPFANDSFDYVVNLGSLEHFLYPLKGVQEMRRVLRSDGLAALYLPNSYYLVDIIWHVWRTGYSVSHKQLVERFATFREWWDLIEEGGLKVQRAYKYNFLFPRSRGDWRWYMQHPAKWLYLFVSPFIPFNLSCSFLYICKK